MAPLEVIASGLPGHREEGPVRILVALDASFVAALVAALIAALIAALVADAADSPEPIDGKYPKILLVRDLASGRELAALPCTEAPAAVVRWCSRC